MRLISIILGIYFLTLSIGFAQPELKGTPQELTEYLTGVPKTIHIRGKAEVKAEVEQAIVTLRIITEQSSLSGAVGENRKIKERVKNQLIEDKISQVITSKFSSIPQPGLFGDTPSSYEVHSLVKVTVGNEREFELVAGIVDRFQAVSYVETLFESSEPDIHNRKALTQALDNAIAKQRIYEKGLNVILKPKKINEFSYMPEPRPAVQTMRASALLKSEASPAAADVPEAGTSLGELVFSAEIEIEFFLIE